MGPDRPNGQTLAQLCTFILSTNSEWPEDISWEICSQSVLNSIYPDPQGEITIQVAELSVKLSGASFRERFCAYHRFLRAGRLAEILRQKGIKNGGVERNNPLSHLLLNAL